MYIHDNNHELFYIHPKSARMFLKQAHTIAKNFSKDFFNNPEISASTRKKQDALAKVIYFFKTKLPYSGLKVCDLINKYYELSQDLLQLSNGQHDNKQLEIDQMINRWLAIYPKVDLRLISLVIGPQGKLDYFLAMS